MKLGGGVTKTFLSEDCGSNFTRPDGISAPVSLLVSTIFVNCTLWVMNFERWERRELSIFSE